MRRTDRILKFTLLLAIFYFHISFVFQYTYFQLPYIGIIFSAVLLGGTGLTCLLQSRGLHSRIDLAILLNCPFLLCMMLFQLLAGNYSYAILYVSLLLLLIALRNRNAELFRVVPLRFMLLLELFFLASVFFQILFPGYYLRLMGGFLLPEHYSKVLNWQGRGYYAGFTHQLGTTGLYISYGIALALFYRKRKPAATVLLLAALYLGLLLTGKRAFLVIAVIAPVIVKLYTERKAEKKLLVLYLLLCAAFVGWLLIRNYADVLLSLGGSIKRITNSILGAERDITSGRLYLWKKAFALFRKNPLVGVGIGNYSQLAGTDTEAHNAFLQMLAETGLLGTTLFVATLAANLVYTLKKIKKSRPAGSELKLSLYFQMFFILYSLTGNTVTGMSQIFFYYLFVAFILPCRSLRQVR